MKKEPTAKRNTNITYLDSIFNKNDEIDLTECFKRQKGL